MYYCDNEFVLHVYTCDLTGVGPVNECATNNGGCSQICVDTTDSFTCFCNSGYTLLSDGRTCNGTVTESHVQLKNPLSMYIQHTEK